LTKDVNLNSGNNGTSIIVPNVVLLVLKSHLKTKQMQCVMNLLSFKTKEFVIYHVNYRKWS